METPHETPQEPDPQSTPNPTPPTPSTPATPFEFDQDFIAEQAFTAEQERLDEEILRGERQRKKGGAGTHLTDLGAAHVTNMIIEGKTNNQMNVEMRLKKFIGPRDTISNDTFARYRKSAAVYMRLQRLTDEGIQAGHAGLSAAIITHIEIMAACKKHVLNTKGDLKFGTKEEGNAKLLIAHRLFRNAADFVWDRLGWNDVIVSLLEAQNREIEEVRRGGADEETKKMLVLEIKRTYVELIQKLTDKRREAFGTGVSLEALLQLEVSAAKNPVE